MDAAIEYISRLWPVAVGFVAVVAWLVRVDVKTMQTAKDLAKFEKDTSVQLIALETRIDKRRGEDMDRIGRSLDILQADIKTLLQRGDK